MGQIRDSSKGDFQAYLLALSGDHYISDPYLDSFSSNFHFLISSKIRDYVPYLKFPLYFIYEVSLNFRLSSFYSNEFE